MKMSLISVIVILALTFIVFAIFKKRGGINTDKEPWPFYTKKPLTIPEQTLYHRLVKAMPECIVLSQVQLSRVLGVKKGFNFNEWNNRINRMSLDFIVCLKDSTVVAAIELDDKTHMNPSRIEADAKKNKALADAGIALIRWNVNSIPDEITIRKALA